MVSSLAEGKGLRWCLVWGGKVRQPPPCRICLSRQFVLGLLGVTSCHIPRELHTSCPVHAGFLQGEGLGSFPGLELGNRSQHGSRDWVSALGFRCIKLFLWWRLLADGKAQVTLAAGPLGCG